MKVVVETLDEQTLSLSENDGLTFWKEVIYEGNFHKKTATEDLKFSVDEKLIDHWVATHAEFVKRGIDVPVPKEHSTDVEANRGSVLSLVKGEDSKGRTALFAKIRFRDKEAAQLSKTAKVSVYVPPKWQDEKGNVYERPVRHVALTDYPVINQLDGFLAASHIVAGEDDMPIRELAKELGIDFDSDKDGDQKITAAIVEKFNGMAKKIAAADEPGEDGTTKAPAMSDDEDGTTKAPVAASMVNMLKENRENKVDKLVGEGRITPAVATDLKKQYCEESSLSLALSSDNVDDGFDKLILTLSKNEKVVDFDEETGPQSRRGTLKLSADENPLIKNAEERAKQA